MTTTPLPNSSTKFNWLNIFSKLAFLLFVGILLASTLVCISTSHQRTFTPQSAGVVAIGVVLGFIITRLKRYTELPSSVGRLVILLDLSIFAFYIAGTTQVLVATQLPSSQSMLDNTPGMSKIYLRGNSKKSH